MVLEVYASALETGNFGSNFNARSYRNLSREEQKALDDLWGCDDIVIKQVDEGSAIVVLDKTKYIWEAMPQLDDRVVYVPLNGDPTDQMIEKINEHINGLNANSHVSDKTLEYLLVNSTAKAGRFYLLP